MHYYYSVAKPRQLELKIKRSRFIAHLAYAEDIETAKAFIAEISEQHKTANHNCWAYIVGEQAEVFHASDAGEPSGTAGQPMLNMLKKYEMTNIVAVVTRYFGGVKLGIRGLIEAYGSSVEAVITAQKLAKLVKWQNYEVELSYALAESFKYQIEQMQAQVLASEYQAAVRIKFQVEAHLKAELENYLQQMQAAGKLKILD
ncbi:MAG: YigZ family protein [Candidatus Cloacimonadales bacterium]